MNSSNAIRQLATLVNAGLSPAQAVLYVKQHASKQGVDSQSSPPPEAAAALHWRLATELGAPIGSSLEQLADNLENQNENSRKIQLAFSAPKLTASLITWLPLISIGLAQLLGLNPVGAIFSNAIALAAVVVGVALIAVGHFWAKKLVLAATPNNVDPGLLADAVAMALDAGMPSSRAVAAAVNVYQQELQLEPDAQSSSKISEALELSSTTGAAAANLIRSLAAQLRRDKNHESLEQIAKLNIKLLLPIGATILPAFGLLTIVPVAIGFLATNK